MLSGLRIHRRIRTGPASWLNLSRSGLSAPQRAGRVTVNSRGGVSIRICRGLSFRLGRTR